MSDRLSGTNTSKVPLGIGAGEPEADPTLVKVTNRLRGEDEEEIPIPPPVKGNPEGKGLDEDPSIGFCGDRRKSW